MKDIQGGGHISHGFDAKIGAEDTPIDIAHAERVARFEAIYMEHRRAVLAYCLRRSDPDTARDAMADTFLVMWRRLDEVPAEPLGWLFATARRTLANARRASSRQSSLRDKMRGHADVVHEPGPEQQALRSEEHEAVQIALTRLSPSDQEILRLAAWDDLSTAELSAALDIPAARVSVRLHRAKRRLARAYAAVGAAAAVRVRPREGGR